MPDRWKSALLMTTVLCAFVASPSRTSAQTALSGEPIRITRASGPIVVDGSLGDEGWEGAERVDRWYETNPGDNVDPAVRSVGYITYDDDFFYAGFEFDDPIPAAIRAPYSDRDNISGNFTDYGGVILDTRNDGHSAVLLLATPRGIQYDAISDDASGEDSSPDFFWDASARITDRGWTLEIRVPFSSLRYRSSDPQTWGIFLYRNYPRDFRYQMFSARLPRGGNCFICRANTLVGLERLPGGRHIVAAPYVAASRDTSRDDVVDRSLTAVSRGRVGADVKWTLDADNALDITVKPDFSQIESDTAQITANERFALFFSERRPFFLEGVELFSTPIQAVHTRTITDPRWGTRLTGKAAGIGYTALLVDDAGGGSIVVPGPNASALAAQDFGSYVMVARAKRDIGRSFVSLLATGRRHQDESGHSWVFGPDFQWRPSASEVVTAQWLVNHTETPRRPDLADEWTGRSLASHAAHVDWQHSSVHLDVTGRFEDLGDDFRADTGFVPQVGSRETYGEAGWTFRPTGFARRVRASMTATRQMDRGGGLISRTITPTAQLDVKWSGTLRLRYIDDRTRSGARTLPRRQFGYLARFSPSRRVAQVSLDGVVGGDIDFEHDRPASGATVNANVRLNPTDHLELMLLQNQRWLSVDDAGGERERLLVSRISRVRATYMFTARSFVRVVSQYVSTTREPSLFLLDVRRRSGTLSGSVLLAYKINWQSVLFVGYGDDRTLSEGGALRPSADRIFVKMSYAFQR